jgi:hypothetical protein
MKSRKRNLGDVQDLWAKPPVKEEYHEWSETRIVKPQSQKRSKYIPSLLPSVEPPTHAASYNPDREEHQRAVVEAINEQIHNIREYNEVERQVRAPRKKDSRTHIFGLRKFSKAELKQLASPATLRGTGDSDESQADEEGEDSSQEDSSDDESSDEESSEESSDSEERDSLDEIADGEMHPEKVKKEKRERKPRVVEKKEKSQKSNKEEKAHKLHDGHLTQTERNKLRKKERNVRLSRKHQRRKERRLVPFETHLARAGDAVKEKEARAELSAQRHVRKEAREKVATKKLGSVQYKAMLSEPILEEELPGSLREVAGMLLSFEFFIFRFLLFFCSFFLSFFL